MPKGLLKRSSENKVAAKIREAIGAGPNEAVEIVTPQFERPASDPKPVAPSEELFAALPSMTPAELREAGLRLWDDDEPQLWLLPGEWYRHIPDGAALTSIMGRNFTFERGKTDDDIRFGCLAYGILRHKH